MKKCNTCKKELSLSEFHKHAGRKDGYREKCKKCRRPELEATLAREMKQRKDTFAERFPERSKIKGCAFCTKPFLPRKAGGPLQKYCSKTCNTKALSKIRHKTNPYRLEVYYKNNPNYQSERRLVLKRKVLEAYGPECNCCGEREEEFLTVDHIEGGGKLHRKIVGDLYLWLVKNNFPSGFQVLCMNCNWGRRLTGICPHQMTKILSSIMGASNFITTTSAISTHATAIE